jgi:predicted nucleotidyltransferase
MKTGREQILSQVQDALQKTKCVSSARVYGFWLYNERCVDMDITVMVQNEFGVVDPQHYRILRELRTLLCEKTKQDIDLVPHTDASG